MMRIEDGNVHLLQSRERLRRMNTRERKAVLAPLNHDLGAPDCGLQCDPGFCKCNIVFKSGADGGLEGCRQSPREWGRLLQRQPGPTFRTVEHRCKVQSIRVI